MDGKVVFKVAYVSSKRMYVVKSLHQISGGGYDICG